MAVTPPCRNKLYPTGVPWASSKQKLKNEQRNQMLAFVRRAVLVEGSCFWVENPHTSWFLRQVAPELTWELVDSWKNVGELRLDFCRFGTP